MNQKPHLDRDNGLSSVLKEWRVEASLPPRFREGVWRLLGSLLTGDHSQVVGDPG